MSWLLILSMLVKSGVVAGAGLSGAHLLARRAADRVDILRATVVLLLALPLVMVLAPDLGLAWLPAAAPVGPVAPMPLWSGEVGPIAGFAVSGSIPWPSWTELALTGVAVVWIAGAALIAARLMLGLHTLEGWTRQGTPVRCDCWTGPLQRLSPKARPRLVSSDRISSPLSWGMAPGVILVDRVSLADRAAADAILAHELAHLRRGDWLFLILSRVALALFWFNPLVWTVHAALAARSEEAADAAAVEGLDRKAYARSLVRLAAQPTPLAATAMAADSRNLKTRIACIMSETSPRRRPMAVALTIAALTAVATPLAALELHRQTCEDVASRPAPLPAPLSMQPPAPPPAPVPRWSPQVSGMMARPAPPPRPAPAVLPVEYVGRDGYYGYRSSSTPESRAQRAEARAQAEVARHESESVRRQADLARRQADIARRGADHARVAADQARVAADQARIMGERAEVQAGEHMANGRMQMREGSAQMQQGARQMREESARLRDPAYRARQIAQNRQRGYIVTDLELKAMIPQLLTQADDLEDQAEQLLRQANDPA